MELQKVVDSTTQIPGGATTFFLDANEPKYCDLGLVFVGHEAPGKRSGIYLFNGAEISVVVDEDSQISGTGGVADLDQPSCDQGRIAFRARNLSDGQSGIFEWTGGEARFLALASTPLPGTSHSVAGLGSPAVFGPTVSFRGLESVVSVESLFLAETGVFSEVADSLLVPPGQSLPFSVLTAADNGGELVFRGLFADQTSGIYAHGDGALRVIADYSTPIVDWPGVSLGGFGVPKVSSGQIVFSALTSATGRGVFLSEGGEVRTLVVNSLPLPNGGVLGDVGAVDIDHGVVAFVGFAENSVRERLLVWKSGELEEVLAAGGELDGRTVATFRFSLESSHLAVWVLFQDGSAAIFQGFVGVEQSVPEVPAISPGGLLLLTLTLSILAFMRLRSGIKLGRSRPLFQR